MVTRSDGELLLGARTGDRAALEALLSRHAPAVMRFARRLCDDPADADDVVQETLIAAARRLSELEDERAIRSWFYTVARSFCAKKRRRSRYAPPAMAELEEADIASDGRGPDEDAAGSEIGGALAQAIRGLDPKYREVLVLRDVEGLTAPEVADALGIEVDAVKSRLHRARAAVRARMAPALGSGPGAACPDVADPFSRFLEGEIGPAECAALQEHIATCASCNGACASLKRVVNVCRQAGEEVPADVASRVRDALRVVIGPET